MGPLEAVVIGTVDLGEADRIARLLSPDQGRWSVMVRRARASRKRFAGLLQTGNQVVLHTHRGRGQLPVLSSGDLARGPRRARADLDRIALLAYGCELCAALAPEHHPAHRLYRLLVTWLDLLEGEALPGEASRMALEAKALTFAGLTPALVRCARCGGPVEDPMVFDPEAGGALHSRCGGGRAVSTHQLLTLEALRRTPLAATPSAQAPPVRWLLSDFTQHQLGRPLRSRGLLEGLVGGADRRG